MNTATLPHEPSPSSWRWAMLMAAPHRLGFFGAAMVLLASALWWWLEILSRSGVWPVTLHAVPATIVHALLMSLGFMPLFFVGFLFTAGPKWLRMPDVPARQLAWPVALMVLGWLAVMCGAHLHHVVAGVGGALAALAWAWLCARFALLVQASPAEDRLHAGLIALACSLGAVAMAAAAWGMCAADFHLTRQATLLGLWLAIVPVYVVVAHRMIPFFTAAALPALDAWRPNWLLWTMLSMVGAQALWVVSDDLGWQGPWLSGARAVCSALSGGLMLALAVRWGLVQSLRIRLLAMLHVGFVWLGVAWMLDAVATMWGSAWGGTWGGQAPAMLNLMPLHALTMGFLASVMIAMVTRVSCGHGGRTLTADNIAWGLFWGLQVAVLLRLAAALWPAASQGLLVLAASAWLLVMGAWAVRYSRWYGRPRVDGKPG